MTKLLPNRKNIMPLILRKCQENGLSRNNFYYGNVGETVTAPDWNPEPVCGNGLHGLLEGNGNWNLLEGTNWLIIEANESDIVNIVNIDDHKCKFHTGKMLFRGSKEQLANSEFPAKFNNLSSYAAYHWAINIGNHDIMMHKITDPDYAYYWALNIGNHDVMKPKVTNPYYIRFWNQSFPDNKISTESY